MSSQLKRKFVLGLLLFAVAGLVGMAAELSEARALKLDQPPKLDGKLDEPFWEQAKSNGNFFVHRGDGKRTDDTEFKVAYDNTWLYFGVRCSNDQLHRFKAKHQSHEDPVITDDSVELFLDPAGDGSIYFHYMLSFNNIHREQIVRNGVKDWTWNMPWLSATVHDRT